MTIKARLQRLEGEARRQGLGSASCPACRDRVGRVAVVAALQQTDGTVVEAPGLTPCASCGRLPEQVVRVLETVVAPRPG